jgi:predicted nucleic acid-binding protein
VSYLLDTCTILEMLRPTPSKHVLAWLGAIPAQALFISVLSLGEIRKGIEKLDEGARRRRLAAWLEFEVPAWFGNNVLGIDAATSDEWGRLAARCQKTFSAVDALIAATALHHRLSVVTRNERDFAPMAVSIVNPWIP